MIHARIVADSVNPAGDRLVSFLLTYHRYIHSEFMTHRVLSRNAASSRARPVGKVLASISQCMAEPVSWGVNQGGMQAGGELSGWRRWLARLLWRTSGHVAVLFARGLNALGAHKQVVNRVTEPYSHITVLASGTDWGNFFNLRCHPDAQPEIQALAYAMLDAYQASAPRELRAGRWHLPFADKYLAEGLTEPQLLKITTARAARLSYMTFEGDIDHAKDYDLHDRLLKSGHFSPFEHAARAMTESKRVGNFRGFFPYRKTLGGENQAFFDPEALYRRRGVAA